VSEEKDSLIHALRLRFGLDESASQSVVDYAVSLSEPNRKANDYALAKHLNERAIAIFALVADIRGSWPDVTDLNRSYVLLVDELKKLYERNAELSKIKETICWQVFDVIDYLEPSKLYDYTSNVDDYGHEHNSKVNRLCISTDKQVPDIPAILKKTLSEADKNITAFTVELDEMRAQREASTKGWLIPEYILTYDDIRGVIKINGVYQLNKRSTNDGSNIDMLLTQALAKPNEPFTPILNDTLKNLSSILSGVGFDPTLRKLFFPTARKGKGIFWRPVVSRAEADDERIDTADLDLKLKEEGATTKPVSPF